MPERTDSERLDWLESLSQPPNWPQLNYSRDVASNKRGKWKLLVRLDRPENVIYTKPGGSIRQAIDAAMDQEKTSNESG